MTKNWDGPVLDRALELVQKGWAKGVYARDAHGRKVEIHDKKACAFCVLGAVRRAEWELNVPVQMCGRVRAKLERAVGRVSLVSYNDSSRNKRCITDLLERVRSWP